MTLDFNAWFNIYPTGRLSLILLPLQWHCFTYFIFVNVNLEHSHFSENVAALYEILLSKLWLQSVENMYYIIWKFNAILMFVWRRKTIFLMPLTLANRKKPLKFYLISFLSFNDIPNNVVIVSHICKAKTIAKNFIL